VITWPSLKAAVAAGLIDRGPEIDFHRGQSSAHLWVLTLAGQAAAAALPPVDLDALFVAPKGSSPEVLAAARVKRLARKVIGVLTFNGGRIRGDRVMFVGGEGLVAGYASAYRGPLPDDVMALIRPHCEQFVDIDGKESLRITVAGIAATARPKQNR
jgi:hypothetical protein